MLEALLTVLVTSLVLPAILWLFVYIFVDEEAFQASPIEDKNSDWRRWEDREARELRKDLEDVRNERGVNIVKYVRGGQAAEREREALAELGIAESRTAVRRDNNREKPGDSWLCDNRPIWLGAIQFFVTGALGGFITIIAVSVGVTHPLVAATICFVVFVVASVILGLQNFYSVQENTRLGIKRFGEQLLGFKKPGFAILVPFGIEQPEVVPLQDMVWGPNADGDTAEETFHLPGALGVETNPSPGVFRVVLNGRWPMTIIMAITIRVRRQYKRAWWLYLNAYTTPTEISEQIAAATVAVLSTQTREVETAVLEQVGRGRQQAQTQEEETDEAVRMLLVFVNRIPEISANILSALQEVGRERLAGLLPVSVSFANIIPTDDFQQMLQRIDQAKVKRLEQRLEGAAIIERLQHIGNYLNRLPAETIEAVLTADRLHTQRQIIERSGRTSLDVIANALGVKFTTDATKEKEGE